jgi:16S rRNA (guanine527-N7)-methyltransferase|uniref:16S rRNA (guanine(527)-N(7))-methyltransferase RsmG n=1 Tax=Polynucleobacter sp. TaxID=2029855 RepID=UPI0040471CFA
MEKDSQQALLIQLSDGVRSLHLNLSTETIQRLLDYLIEFQRWNKTHNLSSIHDLNQSVTLHLLDSLAALPYLDKYIDHLPKSEEVFTLADLGSGGGLPGIPFAICRPTWKIHLMEAVQKKAVFLQHIVTKLNLGNVKVHGTRIEDAAPGLASSVSCCISRAFSEFGKFIALSEPMLKKDGLLWAMKARVLDADLKTIPSTWKIQNDYLFSVPGLDAERRLYELARVRKLKA